MENSGFDLVGLVVAGGLTTYPLLIGSVVAMAVVFDRLWALRGVERSIVRTGTSLATTMSKGNVQEVCGELDRLEGKATVAIAVLGPVARLIVKPGVVTDLNRVAETRQLEALDGLRSRLWVLATIGSAAPFVGLFGTVVGIMKSFHVIGQSGAGGFAMVAAGISEALVATALGLAVAIVAVGFYNYFEARLERVEGALRVHAARLIETVGSLGSFSSGTGN